MTNERFFSYKWREHSLRLTNLVEILLCQLTKVNNSSWVDMLLPSDTLSCFRANQSLLFLLNAAYFAENQQIPIYTLQIDSNPQSTTFEARMLTITPMMQFYNICSNCLQTLKWNKIVHSINKAQYNMINELKNNIHDQISNQIVLMTGLWTFIQ